MPRLSAGPETLPPPSAGADEIRKGAEEVLSRPEFQQPPKSLYQRALEEIAERVAQFLDLVLGGGRGAVAAWLVLVVMVVAIGWLVVRGLQRDRRQSGRTDGDGIEVEARRPAADWAAEATRFEAAGAWRDGLRCRYRWMIASLAGAGVVEEIPGTTAGEYRAVVGAVVPSAAQPMAGATELFERAWYGNIGTGPQEASAFSDLAGKVLTGSSAAGGRPPS